MDADQIAKPARAHIQLFATAESAPLRWRLLSGKNRELGRGTGEFDDLVSCRAGIAHLQAVLGELEPRVHRCGSNHWTWSLALAGVPVAISGAQHARLIRCRQGLAQFVAQFAHSTIGTSVMFSHSRRWAGVPGSGLIDARGRS